jgi:hypothetical protein
LPYLSVSRRILLIVFSYEGRGKARSARALLCIPPAGITRVPPYRPDLGSPPGPGPSFVPAPWSENSPKSLCFLLVTLNRLQHLVGTIEASAARVPDPLHHLLWCPIVLGGRGDLLLLGWEPHARQVLQEGQTYGWPALARQHLRAGPMVRDYSGSLRQRSTSSGRATQECLRFS